ncbi:MAG: CHRD domain-containing protein, partial [Deltaproteobacteria bacterium]|nr:CHRD domain-containing protein [Deltaproteobacteria bacterium]
MNLVTAINGAQETPPTGSSGAGFGTFTLDTVAHTLDYNITFGGIPSAELAAHIHGPAGLGIPAGVLFGLPLGSPKVGTLTGLSPGDESNFLAGLTYVNIHTIDFPGGEIRGQLIPLHDSAVIPGNAFKVTIPKTQATVTKFVKVKVLNADDKTEPLPDTIQLVPTGSCTGVTIGTPDFDPSTPTPEDTVSLAGGKSKAAKVAVTVDSSLITTTNPKAPYRCTFDFSSTTILSGPNNDPT